VAAGVAAGAAVAAAVGAGVACAAEICCQAAAGLAWWFGTAAKRVPVAVKAPPPAALTWQTPHAWPVGAV
jgi:hypothetical protein